ncbi:3beta-hydroxysteroid-dehydrogenase/decarboxylase [Henckelia pumila]|uniref:3beta-hydroxysteroid- dehydrogenase/decarboxylase n=1 Tax=Henckelia pumila TaxID=405737 RepID=UPI003C6E14FF
MAKEIGDDDSAMEVKTCVVLGGRGFIGRAVVERLLKLGNWSVRVVGSTENPQLLSSESLLAHAISCGRASYFHVDVRKKAQIVQAIEGASVVFYTDHVDLLFPDDFSSCYTIIVQGTKNIIHACRECKVKQLIYNSSADVVFHGSRDIRNGNESMPQSDHFKDLVTELKAQSESLILFANDIDGLLTCVLRPCNVFGPGEKHLLPSLVTMAQSSWAKFIIGSADNLSDFTYVDNVAHAHICAEESLSSRMVSVCGKVFFITNMEAMKFWDFTSLVLGGLGYERPVISLPSWTSHCVVFLAKLLHAKSNAWKLDSIVSVYNVAASAFCTRTFSCSAANNYLQYSPIVSMEEGIRLTVDSSPDISRDSPCMKHIYSDERSKVDKLLGGGKVADILLWRDEKKTFFCFLFLVLLYQWFFFSGRTFMSSCAKLLLLIVTLLRGNQILPSNIYGWKIPEVSSQFFEISEVDMRNFVSALAWMWNGMCHLIKSLGEGTDWSTFLKVSTSLYACNLIIQCFLRMALGVALVLAFTLCFTYEQYEKEIDEMATVILTSSKKAMILFAKKLPKPLTKILSV